MGSRQTQIPCAILRGGTSRGVYFLGKDLPADESMRDATLLKVIGGPDKLQVDGIGGGHPLTNKIAVISPSQRDDADVDYLFLQVTPQESSVSDVQNCGNILAGVGPFAIEAGLVDPDSPITRIRVHMANSGNLCELTVETPDGIVNYEGQTEIDGVPGSGAPIICDFLDVAGSACGELLPTGNTIDTIDGVQMTCIDNGMPVVVLRADDFAISGYEPPDELEANEKLRSKLEALRLRAGPLMNLDDVTDKTVPKMCLVAPPRQGGHLSTRTFIPHVCHRSIGVLGAVSVASVCLMPNSITNGIAVVPEGQVKSIIIEHPSGTFTARLVVDDNDAARIKRVGVIRTARMLFRGEVHVPQSV